MGLFDGLDFGQLADMFGPSDAMAATPQAQPPAVDPAELQAAKNAIAQGVAGGQMPTFAPGGDTLTRNVQPVGAAMPPAQPTQAPEPTPAQAPFRLNPPGVVTNDQRAESSIAPNTPLVPPADVGSALTGTSTGRAPGGGEASTGEQNVNTSEQNSLLDAKAQQRGNLAEALKGVNAPKPPEVQKIQSPSAPKPTGTIKSGDLLALLQALNAHAGVRAPTLGRG